jgi:hypothetical protein
MAWAHDKNLSLPQKLTDDVPQLMVHHIDPTGGGCGQRDQKHHGRGHVLDGPGKGWTRQPFMVDGTGDVPSLNSGFGKVDGGGSLHPQRGLASM